jgi:AraC-like DNA-binding protein
MLTYQPPAMSSFALTVTVGGYHHCGRSWSIPETFSADYHRIYIPVSGQARQALGEQWTEFRPGQVYFIPAHTRNRRLCEREMQVHWLHLQADSQLLAQQLQQVRSIVSWPEVQWRWARPIYQRLCEFSPVADPVYAAGVHGFAATVVAAAIIPAPHAMAANRQQRQRFQAALEVIEKRFPRTVPAAALAQVMGMSVVHFRRSFKEAFGLPPHAFVSRRRMEDASRLLIESALPVAEIAASCGYPDEFYFSRAFKQHHRLSPLAYRRDRSRLP